MQQPVPLSAAQACASQKQYSQLACGPDGSLYWLETQPEHQGRTALCHYRADTGSTVLTPPAFNVRSRVHEYGGACWCLLDQALVFVNNDDQQLWTQPLAADSEPQQLTDQPRSRFAAPVWDSRRNRLLAVQEIHQENGVENQLVAISLADGSVSIVHHGHDFYGQPALSGDGKQLSWVSWDHPHQPWTETLLYHARLDIHGKPETIQIVAGTEQAESITQPHFDPQQQLIAISDRNGDWQPWRYTCADQALLTTQVPLTQQPGEYSPAPWQLGNCNLRWLSAEHWIGASHRQGSAQLTLYSVDGPQTLTQSFSQISELAHHGGNLYAVAASPTALPQVVQFNLSNGQCNALTQSPLQLSDPALPVALEIPLPRTQPAEQRTNPPCCYGYFYRPAGKQQPPPLLITLHGGPTATSYPVLKPALQFWTDRGFAVLELNYRGSTGYGRDYRLQLQHNWGVSDIDDANAAIDWLASQGWINPAQVFIRGGSAGGYTSLAALVNNPRYRAAACHYGISDLNLLARHTHKFESRYLDWLIGDVKQHQARYLARSPLHNIEQINTPVIFFQGLQDKVVPPEQTEQMARSLQQRGIKSEYHSFENEGHGFRQPENQQQVLEWELAFYQRYL